MRKASGNSRNGYRERLPLTCVGKPTLRMPKLHSSSLFFEDVIERYQQVDRVLSAAVTEMYAPGTSIRKVRWVAAKMGVGRLSKDCTSAIAESLDAGAVELLVRDLGGSATPRIWLGTAYVKSCREGRVASTAVVTAIGRNAEWRWHVLWLSIVDTEPHDS